MPKKIKVLTIHFNNGEKRAVRGMDDAELNDFIYFMRDNQYSSPIYRIDQEWIGEQVDLYIPRQSVSYFTVQEVAE